MRPDGVVRGTPSILLLVGGLIVLLAGCRVPGPEPQGAATAATTPGVANDASGPGSDASGASGDAGAMQAADDAAAEPRIACPSSSAPSSAPVPVVPANGSLTGSVWAPAAAATLRPVFRWRPPSSPPCREPNYQLVVDDSCPLPGFAQCEFPSPEVRELELDESSWQPPAVLVVSTEPPVGRRYYWRVRACCEDACGEWSAVRSIDVGRVADDFDGDGYSDLVLATPHRSTTAYRAGNVIVFRGGPDGVNPAPVARLDGPSPHPYGGFGSTAVPVGDVNADGFSDLVATINDCLAGEEPCWSALRYAGGPSGLQEPPADVLRQDPAADTAFGVPSAAGDVNGDGFPDLVRKVDCRHVDFGCAGGAGLWLGGASGWAQPPHAILANPSTNGDDLFARVLAAGDLNLDGFSDLFVAAPLEGTARDFQSGRVYVFCGNPSGVSATPAGELENPTGGVSGVFGSSMTVADLDADGRSDVAITTEWGRPDTPAAFVHVAGAGGLPVAPSFGLERPPCGAGCGFGSDTVALGDLTGDGLVDAVVGAVADGEVLPSRSACEDCGGWGHCGSSMCSSSAGQVHLYRGTQAGLDPTVAASLSNPLAPEASDFGLAVDASRDFNGDGIADLVVAADRRDINHTLVLVVYHGGLDRLPEASDVILDAPPGGYEACAEPAGAYFDDE